MCAHTHTHCNIYLCIAVAAAPPCSGMRHVCIYVWICVCVFKLFVCVVAVETIKEWPATCS